MAPHLGLQRIMIPSAQVSSLTTGSITLPSARGAFADNDYYQIATSFNPGSSSVTFSNIPTDYQFLELRSYTKDARSPVYSYWGLRFNGDSTNNYHYHQPQVDTRVGAPYNGSAVNTNGIYTPHPGASASTYYGCSVIRIYDYQNTSKKKVVTFGGGYVAFGDGTSEQGITTAGTGQWSSTSAITSITCVTFSGNFQGNSRISLYGIKG